MPEKALTLISSIKSVKGFGLVRIKALSNLGINTVGQLLSYFPRKHLDRTTVTPISKLEKNFHSTIIGTLEASYLRQGKQKKYFQAILSDGTGVIRLTWFNGANYINKLIKVGDRLAASGKIDFYKGFQIVHPEYDKLQENEDPLNSGSIIPIYSITAALKESGLDNQRIRRSIKSIFDLLIEVPDYFSDSFKKKHGLIKLDEAIRTIHFANSQENLKKAIYRLKFDEHFFLQMLMALRKSSIKQIKTKPFKKISPYIKIITDNLDFELTGSQKKVIKEIKDDMSQSYSMNRLLQGDVGSGKTIVAILASAIAVTNNSQVAIMVPTEILANQHFSAFKKILDKVQITCALLVGGTPKKERKSILEGLENGLINIIIGTHSLIQPDIKFKNLGLVIFDEQHRFGVLQRGDLISKGSNPHCLAMTATPIPRTLAITYHGDMDVSIINEMPKNRIPIITKVVDEQRLSKVYSFIKDEVSEGKQCMVIYPLVEETEKSDLAAAVEMHTYLSEKIFKELNVGLIHGRMKKTEKDSIMEAYINNKIQILISTTVIEVGIDVPNATVMIIENAERFGLTQLHQLRGRVGRGLHKSYCILVCRNIAENSKKRLRIMESTNDGFVISDEDLKMRGPGEFFGIKQSGFIKFKIADMINDGPILREARTAAFNIVKEDLNLEKSENSLIRKHFMNEYQDKLHETNIS
ncbi:MAG: ATP-dependent DNA helicase RecG [Candidatus Neomarinimicrobiota bacterium]|nr:ATP-dependent DNA helicase RecG [Candidatus Neomarinimicrobiota bacterium]